jgi:hypothetical protein
MYFLFYLKYKPRFTIPESTVMTLENVLISTSSGKQFDAAVFAIQNAISGGQRVSARTLQIFADNLYTSTNSRKRLRAFKIFDQSLINQPDLLDDIFFATELQRAAFGLSMVNKVSKISSIKQNNRI